jgi:signal transduction histidine kinase
VSVTDSGVGIKPEDIGRLFEPFSQLHDTMQKTNAGTGLGLYICKGIVEGHDGRIWCESPGPGKGSTFAFEIPLKA